ncbi:patatin-like phospholipase family protein [Pseudomonas aeruginosa]
MRDKTALVLAGGGSLGAVQVGMLQALADEPVSFDLVVGASVGAINGAFFASRPNAEGAAELAEIWCDLGRHDIFPFSVLGATKALLRRSGHLLSNDGLSRLIQDGLPLKYLEESVLPLHVVTTDLLSGAEVLLSRGSILDALLASAAIPLVYPPVAIDGRLLIDGGVASNTPIASAVALGATRIVVLPTGFGCACKAPPKGFVALALHTLNLMSMRQLIRDIELHDRRVRIHVAAPLCPLGVSVFDFTQTRDLIERARVQTQAWLRTGGLDQTGVPDSLRAHSHPEMTDE